MVKYRKKFPCAFLIRPEQMLDWWFPKGEPATIKAACDFINKSVDWKPWPGGIEGDEVVVVINGWYAVTVLGHYQDDAIRIAIGRYMKLKWRGDGDFGGYDPSLGMLVKSVVVANIMEAIEDGPDSV